MGKPTGFLEFERADRKYEPVENRVKHWNEFVVPLAEGELKTQASRCMDCGIPFCHTGCPVNNQIPDWNDLVYRGNWKQAALNLHSTNNFPEVTGRICPAPCEAACTLNIDDAPVTIKSIEGAIADRAWKEGWVVPEPPETKTGKKVAIIGSGPAGLAAAQQLALPVGRGPRFAQGRTAAGAGVAVAAAGHEDHDDMSADGQVRDALAQGLDQRGNVGAALAQRRDIDFNDVEPVVQVLTEDAGRYPGAQVFVGGADDAHIDRVFLRRTQRPDDALLNRAQQLGLHGHGQIANFVEKEGAAFSRLKVTLAVLCRAGVSALAGTKKLGFQQVLRNGAAVDGDKRPRRAVTAVMHGARNQLLAGA